MPDLEDTTTAAAGDDTLNSGSGADNVDGGDAARESGEKAEDED